MSDFLISDIVNQEKDADLSRSFMSIMDDIKASIFEDPFVAEGDLSKVYFQLQLGMQGTPGAVRGIRVGRYNKSARHIEARAELDWDLFEASSEGERRSVIVSRIIELAENVVGKIDEKNLSFNSDGFLKYLSSI